MLRGAIHCKVNIEIKVRHPAWYNLYFHSDTIPPSNVHVTFLYLPMYLPICTAMLYFKQLICNSILVLRIQGEQWPQIKKCPNLLLFQDNLTFWVGFSSMLPYLMVGFFSQNKNFLFPEPASSQGDQKKLCRTTDFRTEYIIFISLLSEEARTFFVFCT